MSVINDAVESVMDLIYALGNFATVRRGALGADEGLSCEIAPSMVAETYMDKNTFIPLTLALNGKNRDLKVLSDAMNNILDTLTRRKEYPNGNGWEIVDITSGNLPRLIGREPDNTWLMAADIVVKIYRKDNRTYEC